MVTTNAECKIKVELGYSEIDDTQRKYTEFSKTEWDQWKETIAAQTTNSKSAHFISCLFNSKPIKVAMANEFVAWLETKP